MTYDENNATADELDDLFGMPDPETDGHMCGLTGCVKTATHVGLDADGVTKIMVCTPDSYNTRFWGVWPIEDDSDYGVAVGAAGKMIHAIEADRRTGEISTPEYYVRVGYALAHTSNVNRWRINTPCVMLHKSGHDVGGFVETA